MWKQADYYHIAPTTERAHIQRHGLQSSTPKHNPFWGEDPEGTLNSQPHGIYAYGWDPEIWGDPTPEDLRYEAWTHAQEHPEQYDIWHIPQHQYQGGEYPDPRGGESAVRLSPSAPVYPTLWEGGPETYGEWPQRTAENFGIAYPGETPQRQEDWQEAAPGEGIPWPDIDPAMWYRINGEDAELANLPMKGGQPIYVHQGTAYVDQLHPGLVEWAGDSNLRLAAMPAPAINVSEGQWGGGYTNRRAVIYDPAGNTMHIGPNESTHGDVITGAFPHIPPGQYPDTLFQGWIGPNPEASRDDPVYNRGTPDEIGWYRNWGPPTKGVRISPAAHRALDEWRKQNWTEEHQEALDPYYYSSRHLAEVPGGGNMADKMKNQQDIEMMNRGDPDWAPHEVNLDAEPRGPFACSQCDYKPSDLADYRMHVEYHHYPMDATPIEDGKFPRLDDFDEPLPLRRMQPKPNSGETVAAVGMISSVTPKLYVIRLPDDRACYNIPQFELYSKLAGFNTPTTVYYGAFDDGELVGYGVVREADSDARGSELMMIQAREQGRGIGTVMLSRIQRDYDHFYTHADSIAGERLMRRCGMVNVKGHLWRYAQGGDPKDMLEAAVPFVFDIPKDRLVLGYPGYDTHDVTDPQGFTPAGIVEGTYEPGGKVTIWTASTWPFSVRHLLDLWKAQAPQMEVTGVEQKELDGNLTKLAGMESQGIGPYMNALVQSSPAATNAYKALKAQGGEVYVVGGPNRDYIQGRTPKDIDMLVRGLQPEDVLHALRQLPGGVKLTGQRFGVYRYWSGRQGEDEVEIALPRTDEYKGGNRANAKITVDPDLPIEKDLERRDFTANATATRLDDGQFVDPYGGAQDITRGILRTTHPNSFKEDPTRLVRALTAHGRFGLNPDERTRHEMEKYAHMLLHESPDTLNKVVDKWFGSPNPAQGVRLAHDTGVLKYLFPEVDDNWNYDQGNPHHNLPLGEHLVHVLDNMSRLTSDPDARLAAFLHDIGKPASRWDDANGVGHYYRNPTTGEGQYHESVGAKQADTLMRQRYNWPAQRTTRISELVRRHMFPPFNDDVGARKFMNKNPEYADDLLHLRESDQEGKGMSVEETAQRTPASQMRDLIEQQREMAAPVSQAAMAINGNDLRNLGMQPGPAIGQVLQSLTDAVLARILRSIRASSCSSWPSSRSMPCRARPVRRLDIGAITDDGMLGLPSRIKYINMDNQQHVRIWASCVATRQLIDVTPPRAIVAEAGEHLGPDPSDPPSGSLGRSRSPRADAEAPRRPVHPTDHLRGARS